MESMGIKFLGTIKDSALYPFEVVDIKKIERVKRETVKLKSIELQGQMAMIQE